MSDRYAHLVTRVHAAVLDGRAVTTPGMRRAAEMRAAVLGGRPAAGASQAGLPGEVTAFVDKIARRAVEVSQEDVDGLRRAGYSEDAIFELVASAALGAGLGRLERGMAALRGAA